MRDLRLEPRVAVSLDRLRRHWNSKLTPTANNPYPLAPRDLVRGGVVNAENYESENKKFGLFCSSKMVMEVTNLAQKPTFQGLSAPRIDIFGAGLGRDLEWVDEALNLGYYVRVYDVSSVACKLVEDRFSINPNSYQLEVVEGEIDTHWNNHQTMVHFASQFVQVQTGSKMCRIMNRFGSLLGNHFSEFSPALYLVHPFGKDNQGVEWGDTTPYSLEEILSVMGEGRVVEMELLGTHSYFHHKYSLLKLQIAKG